MNDLVLVYLVAGMSSRFKGKVKQLAKVGPNGESLIEVSLKQAIEAGIKKVIFVVGEKTCEPFKKYFGKDYNGVEISYAFQSFDKKTRDKPWGTCDAICSAKSLISGPLIVCNGDDLYGQTSFSKLLDHFSNSQEDAILAWRLKEVLPKKGEVSRGIITSKAGYVKSIQECSKITKEKIPETFNEDSLCNMNFIGLRLETLNLLNENLEKFKKENLSSRDTECYLPTELSNLIRGKKIKVKIYEATEKWIGITNPEDELIVKKFLQFSS